MTVLTARDHLGAYLTVAEVAALLRCSEPTIRRRIRDGALPAVQLGGPHSAVRVPRAAFERLNQATKGAPPHEF
ncbi:MAG TPA: helix-turn-helix domain-containing protein [Thermoleophilaceae bacterium]|nr:helix-turn-helix domain-containing protein [Thermoleophilaceae bacterium]